MTSPSTSQVNRAGKVLRAWYGGDRPLLMGPEETAALDVLVEFRACHALPLIKANNGLRSMLRTEGCPVEVSQRLKRLSRQADSRADDGAIAHAGYRGLPSDRKR